MTEMHTVEQLWRRDVERLVRVDERAMHSRVAGGAWGVAGTARTHQSGLEVSGGVLLAGFIAAIAIFKAGAGQRGSASWEWYLVVLGCAVAVALLLTRRRHTVAVLNVGDESVRAMLLECDRTLGRQISNWKTLVWWYCLPIEAPLLFALLRSGGSSRGLWMSLSLLIAIAIVVTGWYFARQMLEPQRRDARRLLSEIDEP